MRIALAVAAALVLGGCTLFRGGYESLPAYVGVVGSVLEAELQADLTRLSTEEILARQRVIERVDQITGEVRVLSAAFVEAIDAELDRREAKVGDPATASPPAGP